MTTGEVTRLTSDGIAHIIRGLPQDDSARYDGQENRQHPRWPSHGTAELRPFHNPQADPKSGLILNISEGGLGMSSEYYFEPDSLQVVVVHLSHATFSSKASVRYCKKVRGEYMTGLAFMLED